MRWNIHKNLIPQLKDFLLKRQFIRDGFSKAFFQRKIGNSIFLMPEYTRRAGENYKENPSVMAGRISLLFVIYLPL